MISNEQMIKNRYGRWAKARRLVGDICDTLNAGGYVVIATATKARRYDVRSVDSFKATKHGAYVQRGKQWDSIDYCGIRFARPVTESETELMQQHRDF